EVAETEQARELEEQRDRQQPGEIEPGRGVGQHETQEDRSRRTHSSSPGNDASRVRGPRKTDKLYGLVRGSPTQSSGTEGKPSPAPGPSTVTSDTSGTAPAASRGAKPEPSIRRPPAADVTALPGGEAGLGAGEVVDQGGDLFRPAGAAQRDAR